MAQLKRSKIFPGLEHLRSIHFCEEVAQLKHSSQSLYGEVGNTIHVWRDVAQLKRHVEFHPQQVYVLSISAKKWPNWNINALAAACSTSVYPCLKRRGPIETQTVYSKEHAQGAPIHVWKDVAQLKQTPFLFGWIPITLSMSERMWPNWNVIGSGSETRMQNFYPCLKRRGPIETRTCWYRTSGSTLLSMTEKSWPNSACCTRVPGYRNWWRGWDYCKENGIGRKGEESKHKPSNGRWDSHTCFCLKIR